MEGRTGRSSSKKRNDEEEELSCGGRTSFLTSHLCHRREGWIKAGSARGGGAYPQPGEGPYRRARAGGKPTGRNRKRMTQFYLGETFLRNSSEDLGGEGKDGVGKRVGGLFLLFLKKRKELSLFGKLFSRGTGRKCGEKMRKRLSSFRFYLTWGNDRQRKCERGHGESSESLLKGILLPWKMRRAWRCAMRRKGIRENGGRGLHARPFLILILEAKRNTKEMRESTTLSQDALPLSEETLNVERCRIII